MPGPTTAEHITGTATATPGRARARTPVVIEARGIHKSFQIPEHRIDSLKERAVHPLRRIEYRELRALRDVSFDIHQGEFFGIVGRNGSGKSSLLKILASIYRADAGRVRMAGRMAPFIELGVGFNPELTARENGVLNGVLMGLTLREARRRLDAVLDFAELRDFVDLKLKNYSSGMMVRFAFALMVQADADIMLIDEVLAVGDAAFAQKCMDVFHDRRRAGKTIVLVTHDMPTVQSLCHRAMLLHDGDLEFIGDPEDTALRYYRRNFGNPADAGGPPVVVDVNVRVLEAALRGPDGAPVESVEPGTPIVVDVLFEAARDLDRPEFQINVLRADGTVVFGRVETLGERVSPGQRVRLAGEIENRLLPGRYTIDCWIRRSEGEEESTIHPTRVLNFRVAGDEKPLGLVSLESNLGPRLEPDVR